MRRAHRALVVLALTAATITAIPTTAAASVFSCDEAGIDAAIAAAAASDPGPHFFDCTEPTYVPLSGQKVLADDIWLEGGRNLILSGQNTHQIFFVNPGVTANLHEVIYTEGESNTGGAIENWGTLVVGGSEFLGNHATNCGAIDSFEASLTIADSFFEGNTATVSGGAVCVRAGTFAIMDSGFFNNHSSNDGGAVRLVDLAAGSIMRTQIGENSASAGAGVFGESITVSVLESSIFANSAENDGGGIHTDDSRVTIQDTHIGENQAGDQGGGLWADDSPLAVERTHFDANHAEDSGGAVSVRASTLALLDSSFTGNHADSDGGAMLVDSTAQVQGVGAFFEGNTAGDEGGAIYNFQGIVVLIESELVNNHALDGGGGAVYNDGDDPIAILSIGASIVAGNTAGESGGAVSNESGSVLVEESDLRDNHAAEGGGAIHTFSDGVTVVSSSTIADNSAETGGGFASYSGAHLEISDSLAVGNTAIVGGVVDSQSAASLVIGSSALLYNTASQNGGAILSNTSGTVENSCIEGNSDIAVDTINPSLLLTNNWWGAADGPSGPTGTGSGDSLDTPGSFAPWSEEPLEPCLFPQAPWNPGRPSTGFCEVLVWFDDATVISDTDADVDHWALTGAARFYDADTDRDRETAVIGITDFHADPGETVILEKQWRTELWAAYSDEIRLDDLAFVLTEDDGRAGDDKGTFFADPNLVFGCGDTLSISLLLGADARAARGQPDTDTTGVIELNITITTVDAHIPPPPDPS